MNIYVGNLPYEIDDGSLQDAFAGFGAVDSAKVIMDRDTGRSKGFGFVEMPDNGEAQAAIDGLNGTDLGGRSITVNEARPRPPRGGGGGFGGGGGGGGGGFAIVYPQASEQVQVVQGAGMVDEDRIRQIIREELIGARLTAGGDARPVDDLAEQQLRSIRERRLQAERELEQLKELLREEM